MRIIFPYTYLDWSYFTCLTNRISFPKKAFFLDFPKNEPISLDFGLEEIYSTMRAFLTFPRELIKASKTSFIRMVYNWPKHRRNPNPNLYKA